MNHGHTQIHKTQDGLDLGEATNFPPYSIIYDWPWGLHPNVSFLETQIESFEIFNIRTFVTLDIYIFLCKPPIEMR
jgi:hypothetical protein